MRFALRPTLVMLLAAGMAVPAAAQGPWSIFIGGGAAGFGGASSVPDGESGAQIKPAPTTRFHAGGARALGRAGVVLDFAYSKSGLGGYGDGSSYALSPALTLYDVRLLFDYRLASFDRSSLHLALGPMLQVWSGEAIVDTQSRVGGAAALTLAVPISGAVGLLVTGSLGVAGCPFDEAILEDAGGFEPENVWTRELAVGIRLAL